MARYIDNIPDGAAHTCSDLCIKPSCLIVRGKQEIESLRKERQQWLTKSKQWGRKIETLEAQVAWMCEAIDEKRARCVELGGLLHEAMEDVKFHLECVLLAENAQDEAVLDDRLYRIRAALGTRADQPSSAPAAGRIAVEDFNDLRKWIQERMQGGCRVFSKGSDCRCPLCLLERVAEGSLPLAADQPGVTHGD